MLDPQIMEILQASEAIAEQLNRLTTAAMAASRAISSLRLEALPPNLRAAVAAVDSTRFEATRAAAALDVLADAMTSRQHAREEEEAARAAAARAGASIN